MSSSNITIKVTNLSKCYEIYETPRDRLKQFFMPVIRRILGRAPKKYFHEFWAMKDVSFEIKKGETIGIIGRNGSGKSTLLQMICGTLTPTGGSIQSNGRVAALLELGSGFNPEFTGRENVYMNASVLGLTTKEIDSRFDEITTFADIGEFIEQPVKTYSSGMMVRLAFAVIAHVDADILVVDEALAVGDAFFTQKCMRFLRNFMKNGTLLFVSHDTASIKGLCTRALWLDKGRVVIEGLPKNICELYLEALYESQQGKSVAQTESAKFDLTKSQKRVSIETKSDVQNEMSTFVFNADAPSFGLGGSMVTSVYFLDENNNSLISIEGGEIVTLIIEANVRSDLDSPIIGFFVKDRLGQMLFGENTYQTRLEASLPCTAGENLKATFVFRMPLLPAGNYSVTVAIANGSVENHVQHHWIHDAVVFKSDSQKVFSGLIGIPMLDLKLEISFPRDNNE